MSAADTVGVSSGATSSASQPVATSGWDVSKSGRTQQLHQDDDWIGLTDAAERRKRQNRLHQRAWRQKKAAAALSAPQSLVFISQQFYQAESKTALSEIKSRESVILCEPVPNPQTQMEQSRENLATFDNNRALHLPRPMNPVSQQFLSLRAANSQPHTTRLIQPVIPYLAADDSHVKPADVTFAFPLCPDHHLITLIQYNVLRAMLTNMSILSLIEFLPRECQGALAIPSEALFVPPSCIPPSLLPTPVQQTTPHDTWVDIVPCPTMRDNLILWRGKFDEDDFCCDIVGGLYEGFDEVETRGIMAWSDPWSTNGWEVSEGFARKWGFLLSGCVELFEATNRWREIRGEDRLVIEV